jgi:hypothetical protein
MRQNAARGGAILETLFLLLSLAAFGFFASVVMWVVRETSDVRANWDTKPPR